MKAVFYGSLIHHLPPTLLAKVKTPWTTERFLEKDPQEDFARALADADVLISMVWNKDFPRAPQLKLIQSPGTGVDFIDFASVPPGVREVRDTNLCRIHVTVDERTGRAMAFAAIDNLWKGAAGQAVQNLNLMLGLDETEGLL